MNIKIKLLVFLATLSLVFNPSPSSSNLLSVSEESVPQIVFLYPTGITNGSTIPLREYIYFTFSGNLSDLSRIESNAFGIQYRWNRGTWYSVDQKFGYGNGVWVIEPFTSPISEYDQWHNLTISVQFDLTIYTYFFQFYADPLYYNEPLSITPINYPNGSDFVSNEKNYPIVFKATGFRTGNSTTLVVDKSTGYDKYVNIPMAVYVKPEFRFDNETEWRRLSYRYFNLFYLNPDFYPSVGWHTLHIRVSNDTHSLEKSYIYNFLEKTIPDNSPPDSFWSAQNYNDAFYWSTGQTVYLISPWGTPFNLTYDWNDGTGNHTLTDWVDFGDGSVGYPLVVPAWNTSFAGWHYLSYWCDNGNYPVEEERFPYCYETVIPQIDLKFPIPTNDTSISVIPIVWSLDVFNGGWWNYTSYKFDLYYDTDLSTDNLYLANFTNIRYTVFNPLAQNKYWYFKSFFNNYKRSYPALFSLAFDLESVFSAESVGSGAQNGSPTQIKFKIVEKTTNTQFNSTVSIKSKISQSSNGIQSAQSDWINIQSAYSAVALTITSELTSNPDTTDTPTSPANVPFGMIGTLLAFALLYSKKRK